MSLSEELTLQQIGRELAGIRGEFAEHAADDARVHQENRDTDKALREALERIEKKLDPLVEVYDGVLFSKKFVVGISTVVIAIGAIGAGFVWLINSVVHK